jgi:glycosyltransferase involved in cell wall biosynthesis
MTGGLSRILRDLATHAATLPEFRVGTLGRLGSYSRHLPFPQYTFQPHEYNNWGEGSLMETWMDFAGAERGIVMTVWDPTRLTWLGMPQTLPDSPLRRWLVAKPFELWGYFPVDGTTPQGTLPSLGMGTVAGYSRVLAYSRYGAQAIGTQDWLPHGLDLSIWKPRGRQAGRDMLRGKAGAHWPLCNDDILIGVVATNQPRKDWGLVAATLAILKQHYGPKLRAWWHTDLVQRSHSWNMHALIEDFGLSNTVLLVTQEWPDREMALAYSACNATLAPGMEGFGYPAVESQACGTPVITASGHGGSEFVTEEGGALVDPVGDRIEGPHNIVRQVHNPQHWAATVDSLIHDDRDPKVVAESESYLDWETLWRGAWSKYFRAGLTK